MKKKMKTKVKKKATKKKLSSSALDFKAAKQALSLCTKLKVLRVMSKENTWRKKQVPLKHLARVLETLIQKFHLTDSKEVLMENQLLEQ